MYSPPCFIPIADKLRERFCEAELIKPLQKYHRHSLFDKIEAGYTEGHRKYHTLGHVQDCLAAFDRFKHLAEDPGSVEVGIFYHDLVYDIDVPSRQNEELSAYALVEALGMYGGIYQKRAQRAHSAVLATTHDHTPSTNDNRLTVDIDLAGLGAPWETFLRNYQNVRLEYGKYSDEAFRAGNAKVLQRFLDRTPLYYHPEIEAAFGTQAKDNLKRWLSRP